MPEKKCRIGYKTAIRGSFVFGTHYDGLAACCHEFNNSFQSTRQSKKDWDSLYENANGINLVSRGDEIKVVLRQSDNGRYWEEEAMNFCPFCGAKIEIIESKVVVLKDKFKQVHDGYHEIVRAKTPL